MKCHVQKCTLKQLYKFFEINMGWEPNGLNHYTGFAWYILGQDKKKKKLLWDSSNNL